MAVTRLPTLFFCMLSMGTYFTEGWVMKRCEKDEECDVTNAQCYRSHCVCAPGFYYSQGKTSCVQSCSESDLVDAFVPYPGTSMENNNIGEGFETENLEPCLKTCGRTPACRSVVYYFRQRRCFLKNKTVKDVDAQSWGKSNTNGDVILLQRRCA